MVHGMADLEDGVLSQRRQRGVHRAQARHTHTLHLLGGRRHLQARGGVGGGWEGEVRQGRDINRRQGEARHHA